MEPDLPDAVIEDLCDAPGIVQQARFSSTGVCRFLLMIGSMVAGATGSFHERPVKVTPYGQTDFTPGSVVDWEKAVAHRMVFLHVFST